MKDKGDQQKMKMTRATNEKKDAPRTRKETLTLEREIYRGKPYEFYRLGRYVVVAPQVAGVKPIFKYTRVRAKRALDMIADGASIEEVAQKLNSAHIPADAVKEALELARKAFVKAHPALRRRKKWSL